MAQLTTLRRIAAVACVAGISAGLAPVHAAAQMTMTLSSATGEGGVNTLIEGYRHAIEIPQDALTARATGRRQHSPFVVRKRLDSATPLLYRAMAGSETIPTVTVRVPTAQGRAGDPVTITLTNARIMGITSGMATGDALAHEEVSFYYETIKWTGTGAGTEFEDSWKEYR